MQRLTLIAATLAALGFSATVFPAGLESQITASDGWVAYNVPKIGGIDGPCCYTVRDGARTKKGCDLDNRNGSFSSDDSTDSSDDTLAVYLKVAHGRVERVRSVGASCPVRSEGTVRWIESVDAGASIAMLSSLLDRKADDKDDGLIALAYHADSSATRALASRAEPSRTFKEREQALFWLGQARGMEGADIVERYATTDANPELRGKAIFALSQSKAPEAYAHILSIARNDPAERVRGEALFWLVQMHDARAKDDIIASLKKESSGRVQEKAVFALSQLDNGADEALIELLRGEYPRPVKKQAMFWLGQSGTPRAMAYFDEALK